MTRNLSVERGVWTMTTSRMYLERREQVLRPSEWFDEPQGLERPPIDPSESLETVGNTAAHEAVAVVRFSSPPSNAHLIALANRLGVPIPEVAEVAAHVEDRVVLRLVMDQAPTDSITYQPFGENPLAFHTEASHWPLNDQPRYLLFFCDAASDASGGAQTILFPMKDLARRLPPDVRATLGRVTFDGCDAPPFFRKDRGEPVFCFRDFDRPFAWRTCDGGSIDPRSVQRALDTMVEALYEPRDVRGIRWRRGDLVLLDNQRLLHGRAIVGVGRASARQLRRLRVRPGDSASVAKLEIDG